MRKLLPDRALPRPSRTCIGRFALSLVALVGIICAGCGYHVAGRASRLPSEWSSIAIPAFKNDTTRYRIEQRLTEAVIREFIERTKYRIVQNVESADGVLHGEVRSVETNPVIFNSTTGEVELMIVTIHTKVLLVDNKTSKPLYESDDMVFRDEYQISSDVQSFFDEQSPALGRMARDFAAKLVSNVVENF
ncbi:MAG TPA: LPS assembly lipoprotein LptE [Candidatus Dormibacteraeota bacterium]|nr:LPS assembly lipoprotein LptE [Candidatus Dormibacteraeota bacterium]